MLSYKIPPPKKIKKGEKDIPCEPYAYRPTVRLDVSKEMAQSAEVGKSAVLAVKGKIVSVEARESQNGDGTKRTSCEICIQPDEILMTEATAKSDIDEILEAEEKDT